MDSSLRRALGTTGYVNKNSIQDETFAKKNNGFKYFYKKASCLTGFRKSLWKLNFYTNFNFISFLFFLFLFWEYLF